MGQNLLLVISIILLVMVFVARLSSRLNVPLIIIALAIGVVFGSDVTGLLYFDDAVFTSNAANIALVFILFAGGFNTKYHHFKPVARPAMSLATAGVVITALVSSLCFSWLSGWSFMHSLLLCTIISSTDAAAVFSILRTRSINRNVSAMTEIESAANDPMAIISVTAIIQLMTGGGVDTARSLLLFFWQLGGGVAIGLTAGRVGSSLFSRLKNIDIGYYYIFMIGIILLSYSLADFCRASGMLSVFFSGFIMGNSKIPFKNGVSSFSEALSFIANVALFILLGLLVFPGQLQGTWLVSLLLFLVLTFIGRPVAVLVCTSFAGLNIREKIFIGWSGLRGAVPIVLATYPVAAGIEDGHVFFNIIFLCVTFSIVIQGTTIGRLADLLRLSGKARTRPGQTMELVTIHETDYELIEVFIDSDAYHGECRISDMGLPSGVTITMVNRDNKIVAPRGSTIILPGDILSVLVSREKIQEITIQIFSRFIRIT